MVKLAIILISYRLLTTDKRQKEKTKGKCDESFEFCWRLFAKEHRT